MLIECCKFGKVIRLVSPEGCLFDSLGCIAVTFENMTSARECSSSLHGRWFDSRQIETKVFSPPLAPSNISSIPTCPSSSFSSSSSSSCSSSSSSLLYQRSSISSADCKESASVLIHNYDINNYNIISNTPIINDPTYSRRVEVDGNDSHPPSHQYGNDVTDSKHLHLEVTSVEPEPDVDDFLNSFL